MCGWSGTRLAERCFELGWIERVRGSRAVTITASGRIGLLATFSIAISNDRKSPSDRGVTPSRDRRSFHT
jgi:hypothetical protein